MGSSFFKGQGKGPTIGGGNPGLEARAIGASNYASRGAGAAAQKGIGQALAINKAGAHKPLKNSAAYPKGPKI